LKQEKEHLEEVQELKRNMPKVGQVNKMEDSLNNRDTGASLRQNIGTINEEMALIDEPLRLGKLAIHVRSVRSKRKWINALL